MTTHSPLAGVILREGSRDDARAIRALVGRFRLNPLSIHWENFIVAAADGRIVGIGQVKSHGDGSRELASIGVAPDWRGRGIAAAIIQGLLARETGELYLTCRASLAPFYAVFGFAVIPLAEMPPYFRRVSALVALLPFRTGKDTLAVMRRRRSAPGPE